MLVLGKLPPHLVLMPLLVRQAAAGSDPHCVQKAGQGCGGGKMGNWQGVGGTVLLNLLAPWALSQGLSHPGNPSEEGNVSQAETNSAPKKPIMRQVSQGTALLAEMRKPPSTGLPVTAHCVTPWPRSPAWTAQP